METNRTPTETEQVVYGMLTENTGRHMLDSGGAYGRNWERNQGKTIEDFMAEPEATIEASVYASGPEMYHVLSVFHFLCAAGDYDARMDRRFSLWGMMGENRDKPWLALAEEFAQRLVERGEIRDYGIVNTYNGEDSLSQVIQYVRFDTNGSDWVYGDTALISVHGGCDVRGGYSRPRAFTLGEDVDLFDNSRGGLHAPAAKRPQDTLPGMEWDYEDTSWYTDDGYNWYSNDSRLVEDLNTYEMREVESLDEVHPNLGFVALFEGKIYCPVNGTEIRAYLY